MTTQHLRATYTPTDQDRSIRLLLAWIGGDLAAFHLVLDEVTDDPTGTPGVLFALLSFTAKMGTDLMPDTFVDGLRMRLASNQLDTADDDGRGVE